MAAEEAVWEMIAIKKPLSLAAEGAGKRFDGCLHDLPFSCHCQAQLPISWLTRSILIKTLVLQRYADVLLICVEFLEEFGHGWN